MKMARVKNKVAFVVTPKKIGKDCVNDEQIYAGYTVNYKII